MDSEDAQIGDVWSCDRGSGAPFTELDNYFGVHHFIVSPFTQLDNYLGVQEGKGGSKLESTFEE